jgi:endonuclease YncB( thermonuclease family)
VALALPVVCHPITGYDTGKASATHNKYFCQKAAQNASQRCLKGRDNSSVQPASTEHFGKLN